MVFFGRSKLYHQKINNGRQRLIFDEIQRNEKTSIVEYRIISMGGATSASVFYVQGLYKIAKDRGDKYFITLRGDKVGDSHDYKSLIGFSKSKDVNIKEYFNLSEDPEQTEFLSVKT